MDVNCNAYFLLSVEMLKDAGYSWTLVGHSERRQNYGETDSIVADKVEVCMKGGMNVVVCVGELLDERKNGKMSDVLTRQMDAFISRVTDWSRVVIAYEPVWAIGKRLLSNCVSGYSCIADNDKNDFFSF